MKVYQNSSQKYGMMGAMVKFVIGATFILFQMVSLALVFAVQYHFRVFGIPGDRRTRQFSRIFLYGYAAFFLLASGLCVAALMEDSPIRTAVFERFL